VKKDSKEALVSTIPETVTNNFENDFGLLFGKKKCFLLLKVCKVCIYIYEMKSMKSWYKFKRKRKKWHISMQLFKNK
jgi:hypothetical protein